MNPGLRKPAMAPPPLVIAPLVCVNPAAALEAHYRRVLAERMQGLPFLNAALDVATLDFQRVEDDWLGAVLTPWSLMLVLVNGGGSLWQDIPAGARRRVALPVGELEFIADTGDGGSLMAWQYCPLIAPLSHIPDMAGALQAAGEVMAALLTPPPQTAPAPVAEPAAAPHQSRRNFLRGRVGAEQISAD